MVEAGRAHSEKPRIRFEAELLPILARGRCECSRQDMRDWGRGMWSHGEQLVCVAKDGGFVQLGFKVGQPGNYRVRVLATAAPDYGKIHFAIDGHAVRREFDLYCGRVSPSGSLELGNHVLAAGQHHLRVTVAGKNAASTVTCLASMPSTFSISERVGKRLRKVIQRPEDTTSQIVSANA